MNYKIVFSSLLVLFIYSEISAVNRTEKELFSGELNLKYAPEQYDSVLCQWYNEEIVSSYDVFYSSLIDLDTTQVISSDVHDSVYIDRVHDIMSPISFTYNDIVKKYIIAYTGRNKELINRVLGLSQYYFPMIEEELMKNDMPLELRMLPVIESGLSPVAVSRMGATGLWQFMYGTGKSYNLEITSFVDERKDPLKATKAACKYLKDMYTLYGDWTLAIASYNCGPGNVNKALKRAGSDAKTFWDVYRYLPTETRGYIPSFIAATYAYTYSMEHNLSLVEPIIPLGTDTINVNKLMHFQQITATIGTPIEVIRTLNPQYKLDIIPAQKKSYSLKLPKGDIMKYLDREGDILRKDTVFLAKYLKPSPNDRSKKIFALGTGATTYRVKKNDNLGAIALKFRVSVSQLMKWNNLRSANRLSIGQVLKIQK